MLGWFNVTHGHLLAGYSPPAISVLSEREGFVLADNENFLKLLIIFCSRQMKQWNSLPVTTSTGTVSGKYLSYYSVD